MKSSAKQMNSHGVSRLIYYENLNQNENRLLQKFALCFKSLVFNFIAAAAHHIFPKYLDTLTPYHT